MSSFWLRIKERRIVQWALAYAAAAWVVLQVLDVAADPWNLPIGAVQGAQILLVAGLFVTILLAWRHGKPGRQPAAILTAALAIAVVAVGVVTAGRFARAGSSASSFEPDGARRSVAVLPFLSRSLDPADELFADGVHDQVLRALSRNRDLRVISRTSTLAFRGVSAPAAQIGNELGVEFLLEGSVQRAGDQVRISAQLVDVRGDEVIWGSEYDRDLTVSNLLLVQTEVANEVARVLELGSSDPRLGAAQSSTSNLEAYDEFVRGQLLWDRRAETRYRLRIIEHMRAAVMLDAGFGDAWALLAQALSLNAGGGSAPEDAPAAQAALGRARDLKPGAPETLLADAFYTYYVDRDYRSALETLSAVRSELPNDVTLLTTMALLYRRFGNWEATVSLAEEAARVDPRSLLPTTLAAAGYRALGDLAAAERKAEQAIAAAPDAPPGYVVKWFNAVASRGDTAAGRRLETEARVPFDRRDWAPVVNATGEQETPVLPFLRRQYESAYRFWQELPANSASMSRHRQYWLTWSAILQGREAVARVWADSLMATSRSEETRWRAQEEIQPAWSIGQTMAYRAFGLAVIGEANEARELVDSALDLVMDGEETHSEWRLRRIRMAVSAYLGDRDRLLEDVRILLGGPSLLTPALLAIDPRYDALVSDPRYRRLAEQVRSN